ncbi:hypothetical protein SETIT_5G276400v2 [Setaria italica]|uniref:Uncharacterized protein n=1 Tax=Setaria italica TaxID=4555 RepID=K3XRP6_SETIT|nr:hypothetical protein SETIT_5G276400v2 [Setaria italica]
MKSRARRGLTLEEPKAAGIPKKLAPTICISVDHRRKNLHGQAYVLQISPWQAGDSTPKELATATQKRSFKVVKVTDEMKESRALQKASLGKDEQASLGSNNTCSISSEDVS